MVKGKTQGITAADGTLKKCDLVMQGGITSGVVYPGAVKELSSEYQFVSVGGASAGAIVAAATAAAELGRKTGKSDFTALDKAMESLDKRGFLLGLFQPTRQAKPAFDVLLKLVTSHDSWFWKGFRAFFELVLTPTLVLIWFAAAVVLALLARSSIQSMPFPSRLLHVALTIGTWFLIAVVLAIIQFWLVLRRLLAALPNQGFGFCFGKRQPRATQEGLTDWIFLQTQQCAGLTATDPPVTFANLERYGIHLKLVTTDLSLARPVTLPFARGSGYLFTESSLKDFLPDAIWGHLMKHSTPKKIAGETYRTVRGDQMPVALAARLSLSFPLLLSAVPLYKIHKEIREKPIRHLFSDGGITSNFPIHFFDEWLPSHPTFGISLQPADQHRGKQDDPKPDDRKQDDPTHNDRKQDDMIGFGRKSEVPRWTKTKSLTGFASQVFDASRNWRDTMQAQLPGSKDRIVSIYMGDKEGGLNLDMDPTVIRTLDSRGRAAGRAIKARFDWPSHQFHRYLTWMQTMQKGLHDAQQSYTDTDFGSLLVKAHFRPLGGSTANDDTWGSQAETVTKRLIARAKSLGVDRVGPLFNTSKPPDPEPVMRVVPDV
jgi:predicted acylesterase/phospholipase RssA